MTIVALIGARSGSRRIPHKNIRELNGHPLMAYTIRAAIDSGIFARVIVSSDSYDYRQIAERYGAETEWRPFPLDEPLSPDIDWLQHVWKYRIVQKCHIQPHMSRACELGTKSCVTHHEDYDCFALLRPTSPFRSVESIRRAWERWQYVNAVKRIDSLRAMDRCRPHPLKAWEPYTEGDGIELVRPYIATTYQAHNHQTAGLPRAWGQCGALEIGWSQNIRDGNMSGTKVLPFSLPGHEGFDINDDEDWEYAEYLIQAGKAKLPEVKG